MKLDPLKHHRRSIRLKGYDYTRLGAYFVTVVAQDRACLFGDVVEGEMRPSVAGLMVQTVWDELPAHYAGVEVDAFVVMPNHVHGIVVLVREGEGSIAGEGGGIGRPGQARGPAPTGDGGISLPEVVHRFKTMTTTRYIEGVREHGWLEFRGRVWQRNYYEQIVRTEAQLNAVRKYISENPRRWVDDENNPNKAR